MELERAKQLKEKEMSKLSSNIAIDQHLKRMREKEEEEKRKYENDLEFRKQLIKDESIKLKHHEELRK